MPVLAHDRGNGLAFATALNVSHSRARPVVTPIRPDQTILAVIVFIELNPKASATWLGSQWLLCQWRPVLAEAEIMRVAITSCCVRLGAARNIAVALSEVHVSVPLRAVF